MKHKKLIFTDIDGLPRGKYISEKKKTKSKDIGFCNVVFGWDMHDDCYPQDSVTGWEKGFPDAKFSIDNSSKRTIHETNANELYFGDFSSDDTFKSVCPRSLLKDVLKQYKDLGLIPKIGFEYEWFNFKKNTEKLEGITFGMFGYSLHRLYENQEFVEDILKETALNGINIEGLHTETGPGVYEAALEYTDVLTACDNAILFKSTVKSIAAKHNFLASFMAKWDENLPGCGGHFHVSLEDVEGNQILDFSNREKIPNRTAQFLEGILLGCSPLLPLYAPTVNSYKRLQPGSWAPTTVSWGYQNRTTALRVISESYANDHIEMRIPGADTNPYLVAYALLASGLYGIQKKLKLSHEVTIGNAYAEENILQLASNLADATKNMENDSLTKKLLNPKFVTHFIKTRKWEVEKYNKTVTNWELNRYIEII